MGSRAQLTCPWLCQSEIGRAFGVCVLFGLLLVSSCGGDAASEVRASPRPSVSDVTLPCSEIPGLSSDTAAPVDSSCTLLDNQNGSCTLRCPVLDAEATGASPHRVSAEVSHRTGNANVAAASGVHTQISHRIGNAGLTDPR